MLPGNVQRARLRGILYALFSGETAGCGLSARKMFGGNSMKSKKIREFLLFALFVFPAVAFVLFATDIPFVMNLYYSVFDWNGVGRHGVCGSGKLCQDLYQ